MNKQLIEAVKEQIGQDDEAGYDPLQDVYNHGISGGFGGFTYYKDTSEFFTKNRQTIIELVKEEAEQFDMDVISFVAGFNCLEDDSETRDEIGRAIYGQPEEDDTQVVNALAWFAAEEVARHIYDN